MLSKNKRFAAALLVFLTVMPHTPARTQATRPTARQVIDSIKKNIGVPWRETTVDTFKAGNPDAPVTGIAVTMMATLEVLRRAAASGRNLIITHEPTFYDHFDKAEDLEREGDGVLAVKRAFIQEHGLIVWRFHDHWHMKSPDGVITGMIRALGWERFQKPDNDRFFVIPETTLENLAAGIKKRLGIRTLRVVGDPRMKVTKLGLSPGFPGFAAQRRMLQLDDVEVLVMGEAHEWETIEYAADAAAAKKGKALIILGHIPSEQAGMDECARWLKSFIKEVPVEFIPASEPFWAPR